MRPEIKKYAAKTDQGPYLNLNEDSLEIDLINNLFMILDGAGGSNTKDLNVTELQKDIKLLYTKLSSDPDSTMPFYYNPKFTIEGNFLINSIYFSHKNLIKKNMNYNINNRFLSSIAIGTYADGIFTFVGVGNCNIYLSRKGKITKIIQEDDLKFFAYDNYQKTINSCPMGGIGMFEDLYLQIKELKVLNDDILIFMSDGTFNRLEEHEIKFIIDKNDQGPREKIDQLFLLNNSRGNLDNQSAIIVCF